MQAPRMLLTPWRFELKMLSPVSFSHEAGTVTVEDTGIGMTREARDISAKVRHVGTFLHMLRGFPGACWGHGPATYLPSAGDDSPFGDHCQVWHQSLHGGRVWITAPQPFKERGFGRACVDPHCRGAQAFWLGFQKASTCHCAHSTHSKR